MLIQKVESMAVECIQMEGITKSYDKNVALSNLNIRIPCGERYALLGPNGAGKSTTLKLLVGLIFPDGGDISIMGNDPRSMEAKRLIGYLPEDASPYVNLSVRENLEYLASLRGLEGIRSRADELMDILDLREYEKYKVNKLSRGNRQKLSIGLAMVHKPKVLLLDEPLNYLDIPTQESVTDLFNSYNATILCSTHIMSIAEKLTENILIIARGSVVWSGSMDDLKSLGSADESVERIVSKLMVSVR